MTLYEQKALIIKRDVIEHSKKVANIASFIATQLGLPAHDVATLKIAGLYHDLGKLVMLNILVKKGPLSQDERMVVRAHPTFSVMLMDNTYANDLIADLIFYHHAYPDGSGFPIKKGKVTLLEQILQASDIFDAIQTDRNYRKKKIDKWDEVILGKGIDSRIVDILRTIESPEQFLTPTPVYLENRFVQLFINAL